MPRKAKRSSHVLNPGRRTASRVAMAPAVIVIGRTAARVSTSQRETKSSGRPSGGLVVRSTSAQADRRPWVVLVPVVAIDQTLTIRACLDILGSCLGWVGHRPGRRIRRLTTTGAEV